MQSVAAFCHLQHPVDVAGNDWSAEGHHIHEDNHPWLVP
jgi:hypothetical protein